MAQKTIQELPPDDVITGDEFFACDDGLETKRVALDLIADYLATIIVPAPIKIEDEEGWEAETTTVTYDELEDVTDRLWVFCRAEYVDGETTIPEAQIALAKIDFPSATEVRVSFDFPPGAGTYILKGK